MFNDFCFEEPTVSSDLLCAIVCDQRNADTRMIKTISEQVAKGELAVDQGFSIVKTAEHEMIGMLTLLYKADIIDLDEFDELMDQTGARYFGAFLKQLKGEE